MDIEFHYYITYILARKGGYSPKDASTIAYACQYVDDNNDIYKVHLGGRKSYRNFISQTLNIFHPKSKKIHLYTCFHFLAGDYSQDTARRNDGLMHIFNTTPDSTNAQKMFTAALDSGNLYRIGIASHCYSDTWSHQNFVGFKHIFNQQKGLIPRLLRMPVMILMPSIGHADFQEQPDIPNLRWIDRRMLGLNKIVRNKQRFIAACEAIFMRFAERNGLDDIQHRWSELAEELETAIGEESTSVKQARGGKEKRIAAYRAICPDMPLYNDKKWLLDSADPMVSPFTRWADSLWQRASLGMICGFDIGSIIKAHWPKFLRIRTFRAKAGFEKSNWRCFQDAVKEHQTFVLDLLLDRYQQIGVGSEKILRMIKKDTCVTMDKKIFDPAWLGEMFASLIINPQFYWRLVVQSKLFFGIKSHV